MDKDNAAVVESAGASSVGSGSVNALEAVGQSMTSSSVGADLGDERRLSESARTSRAGTLSRPGTSGGLAYRSYPGSRPGTSGSGMSYSDRETNVTNMAPRPPSGRYNHTDARSSASTPSQGRVRHFDNRHAGEGSRVEASITVDDGYDMAGIPRRQSGSQMLHGELIRRTRSASGPGQGELLFEASEMYGGDGGMWPSSVGGDGIGGMGGEVWPPRIPQNTRPSRESSAAYDVGGDRAQTVGGNKGSLTLTLILTLTAWRS